MMSFLFDLPPRSAIAFGRLVQFGIVLVGCGWLSGCGHSPPPPAPVGPLVTQTAPETATIKPAAAVPAKPDLPPAIEPDKGPAASPPVDPVPLNPANPANANLPAEPTAEEFPAQQPADKPAEESPENPKEKRRELLFEGWDKPAVALLLTGRQYGYIEPCGCTGLANQKGGLSRRHTLKQQLEARGWPVVALDVGNQVRRFGRQSEIKFQMTIEGLKKIGYQAVAFGPDDLKLSSGELLAITMGDEANPTMFVGANAAVIDPDLTPKFRIIEQAGKKIGVTAILGAKFQKEISNAEIILSPPDEALATVWPKLTEAKCDLYVLLAHASIDESKKLAQQFPHFDLVVTAGGAGEPTFQPEPIPDTKSLLIQVGTKGMFAGVIGLFESEPRLRYQRVPLDDRFGDSREMLRLLASYQKQLETAGLGGLGIKPVAHPDGGKFIGSQACAECHEEAFEVWKDSGHAHALDSLVHPGERSDIPRHFDPECLSCHVTGWNPQQHVPYITGYLSLADSPLLHGSGCENCHGPGASHAAAESGEAAADDATLEKLRAGVRLELTKAEQKCMDCHDLDNSPDFHVKGAFEKYWQKVKH